jgi:hypothetical protein
MKIKHPYAGSAKWLTVDGELLAYVAGLPELPTTKYDERQERYWQDQGLQPEGVDKSGLIPAGEYTDPTKPEVKDALLGLYLHLNGKPITRHLVAVAMNFRCYADVDAVRKTFTDEDFKLVTRGGIGKRVRAIVDTPAEPVSEEPTVEVPAPKTRGKKAADKLAEQHPVAS